MAESQTYSIAELANKAKSLVNSVLTEDENTFTEESADHLKNVKLILQSIRKQDLANQKSVQESQQEFEKLRLKADLLKAVLNCFAQQAQNVFTHLQIHFLSKRYKIGKPGQGSDLG